MPNLSLTNFDPRIADLQRQQKLAELLQQQSQQPIQIQSYKGIQAPISPLEGLAKVLQAYASASKGKKLAKEEGAIQTGQRTEAMDALKRLTSPTQSDLTTMPAPSGPLEGNQGLLAALKGRMGLSPPPAAPSMPPPPQMAPAPPPQAMAPPPPQPSPEGITPAGPPQMAVDPNPQLRTTPEGPPVSHATSPQDRQQMALEAMVSGNPYLKDIAPHLYEQASKEVETARMAAAMNSTGLPADLQASFQRHVAGGDIKGAMALVDKASEPRVIGGQLVQRNLQTGKYDTLLDTKDKWEQVDLPKDVQAMTQPGTIVLKSSNGDIKTIKLSDAESAVKMAQDLRKIGIQQAPAWASLRERQSEFAQTQAQKDKAVFAPETIRAMAQQAWQGDKSVFQNLGRGTQGAENIAALRNEIYAQGALAGKSPADLARMNAEFVGQTSAARTAGTRVGAATVSTEELPGLAQMSSEAYNKLPRTQLKPFNQLQHLVMSGTASPEQAAAYTADFAVINAYARAISPTGQPHVADQKKAADLLSGAAGPKEHQAVLDQIIRETDVIKAGATRALHPGAPSAPTGAPQGVDANVWAHMTPQEKALWNH